MLLDRSFNPPDAVRRKAGTFIRIETMQGLHQTNTAFLDQIGFTQPRTTITFSNPNN